MASFDEAIGNHNIETWSIVQIQRKHFYTHVSANWGAKALFKPDATGYDRLAFHVKMFEGKPLTKDVFAYYLGHLAETFIRDFPDQFSEAHLTSSPALEDDDF